jgi:hypothetical protein
VRDAKNSALRLLPKLQGELVSICRRLQPALQCLRFSGFSRAVKSEAVPLWTPLNAIPYEEMWADDVWWLPQVLAGEKVRGFFHFEREILLGYRVLVENG